MLNLLSSLCDAPFIVTNAFFVNPKFRGALLAQGEWNVYQKMEIRVHDGRQASQTPSLKHDGLQLASCFARLDSLELKYIKTQFYRHCEDLIKTVTGCETARAVQHEFRDGVAHAPGAQRGYARGLHTDVCPYIEDTVIIPERKHFAIYNVWCNIDLKQPVRTWPLILCAAPTVDNQDIVYSEALRRTNPLTRMVDCRLIHNSNQLFYYFPNLTADEAIIFRQYDTRQESENLRATFHAAVEDPTSADNAPIRNSIEVRVQATFAESDSERENRRVRFEEMIPTQRTDGSVSTWRHEYMLDWDYG